MAFLQEGVETFDLKITLPLRMKDSVTNEIVNLKNALNRSYYRRGQNKNPDLEADPTALRTKASDHIKSIILNAWLEGERQIAEDRLRAIAEATASLVTLPNLP